MTNYNFAQGGDIHYNENMALYPQNAYIAGKPEYGSSTTLLKPAHHWEGGHYAPVRHLSFGDDQHQIGLNNASTKLKTGDNFLTHILPSMSLFTDLHYVVHTPVAGVNFEIRLASTGAVLGTIDGSVAGDNWITVAGGGIYIPSASNDGVEFAVDAWPVTTPAPVATDPCGVFAACEVPVKFCMTVTAFYKHARAEEYCSPTCWDGCSG